MLLNPTKRRALEDAAYNRHTQNDRMLPQWFLDDEKKYAKPAGYGLALPDDLVDKAKNGLKDITARTLGKVAEAKARKQRRLQRALTKLKKKANAVASKEDLSEREKAREVEKMYKKKLQPKEKGKTLVVGKRFQAGASTVTKLTYAHSLGSLTQTDLLGSLTCSLKLTCLDPATLKRKSGIRPDSK